MATQSLDQLFITPFNALSLEQKPACRAEIGDDSPFDSSSRRTPSRLKSRPPSLKLDMTFVMRVNQALQALPASSASSRTPKILPDLHHGNLNVQQTGSSIRTPPSENSTLSDSISPGYPGQPASTPANPRPRSETLECYSPIICWRPTFLQSPTLSDSPQANCEQQKRSDSQRRDSDGFAWQQKSMETYLLLPSPEVMAISLISQSKDEAPENLSNQP